MQTLRRTVILTCAVLGILTLSLALPAVSATGPKHIRVSQTTVNHYMKQMKIYNGPTFQWPKGSQMNFTCGSLGCAMAFNEIATQGLEKLMALGVGVTGVATAICALSGVGIPVAAVVGLVVAMFTATGAWIATADWWGGNIGIYGSYWLGSLLFTIWCNPVPSEFLTVTTTTTDPVTSTTTTYTQSSTITHSTQSSSSTVVSSTSTTTYTDSCYTNPTNPKVCMYAPQQ